MNMLSGLINTNASSSLGIELIRLDGGTQPREGLNEAYVTELVEALQAGATLPAVDVMYDGACYWLYDGFHRLVAHRKTGRTTIAATVHQGDLAAAQWESYAANQSHGLRRSQADKERAIRAALKHPQGVKMANSLIAKHLGVSDNTVRKYREEMESTSQIAKSSERVGADGRTINTANIGANRQSPTRRYESGLPALNMPASAKLPITDWELSDIAETVANEVFGSIATASSAMLSAAAHQTGAYWQKLQRSLEPFDASTNRIQAAVADAAQRMAAERGVTSAPSPAEAQQTAREIKADTWGNKPYAEVWEIQHALGRWEHGLTTGELRTLARFRGGANWFACRQALGELNYRDRDLVQALNNLASQMEQRAQPTPVDTELDPWAAAWAIQRYDRLQDRCQRLAVAMTDWARAWTDNNGRSWVDVVDRNPQHANSPFRQAAAAECQRRGLSVAEEGMAETIRRLFGLLTADDPQVMQPAPDLETDGDRPLPAWVDDRIDSADAVTVRDVELAAQAAATNLPALTANTMANMLRPLTAEFYDDGSDYWRTNAARDMRANAVSKDGAFWRRCIATLDHSAYRQHQHWTTGLLRQALEMLADEMPATPLTPPVSPPIAVPLKPAPDDRIGRARRLIAGYQATISTFDEYGELIGAHLETLPAKRELEKLIKHLTREIDLMEGKVVEETWG